jgi:hypothetical protein
MELRNPGRIAHDPVRADPSPADALQEPGEEIDPAPVARSPTPRLGPADLLDPAEQLIRDRRDGAPSCSAALLGRTAVATNPAVVQRVAQDVADPVRREASLDGEPLDADRADGVPLEERDGEPDGRGINLERVGRLGPPAEAKRRIAGLVIVRLELRAVAVDDLSARRRV